MSIIEDVFFGGAEKKAAKQQRKALEAGIDEQKRQFDLNRQDLAPQIDAGNLAREQELAFLGLKGPEAEQQALDSFIESPGQAFLRKRAERALLRNSSAIGGLGGGNVRQALQEQAIGISAGQLSERKDRLAQVSGSGARGAVNLASLGSNSAANISNLLGQVGTANAAGTVGRASGIRNTLSNVAKAFI